MSFACLVSLGGGGRQADCGAGIWTPFRCPRFYVSGRIARASMRVDVEAIARIVLFSKEKMWQNQSN